MNEETKSPEIQNFLDEFGLKFFGRSRSLAKAGNGCVMCGGPADIFRDELSRREFGISGICQECQDKFFTE